MKSINELALISSVVIGMCLTAYAQDDAVGTPLEDVTQEMKAASNQLSKKATDRQTQRPQEQAISKLDLLIAELEKQKQALGSEINPNPSTPANSSTIRKGPGGMGDLHGAKEQGNRWGELPAHERDRILQSMTEGFPPHYQAVLEAYYKRLAVEKKADDAEPMPKEPKAEEKTKVKTETPLSTQPVPAKARMRTKKDAP